MMIHNITYIKRQPLITRPEHVYKGSDRRKNQQHPPEKNLNTYVDTQTSFASYVEMYSDQSRISTIDERI